MANPTKKIRILSGDMVGFSRQLVQGFDFFRRELARALAIETEVEAYESPASLREGLAREGADLRIVLPRFTESATDLIEVLAEARQQRPERPLVLLDSLDSTSSPWFGVLPYVDRYVKSKTLRDVADYQKEYLGGYVFSDYYARTYDFDLEDWHFGSIPDPRYADRIVPGWNFAVARRMIWLARANRLVRKPIASRRYDLNLRIALSARDQDREWYQDYRGRSARAAEPLRERYRVTSEERVGQLRFLQEMRQSRIVFSPFGWGEVCWRDYEAVACGALLLKPSMDHLVTTPDVFVDGETYVSTRWDLSDLEEKVESCLANVGEMQRIADNASRVLRDYFERGGFIADVRRTLGPLLERE